MFICCFFLFVVVVSLSVLLFGLIFYNFFRSSSLEWLISGLQGWSLSCCLVLSDLVPSHQVCWSVLISSYLVSFYLLFFPLPISPHLISHQVSLSHHICFPLLFFSPHVILSFFVPWFYPLFLSFLPYPHLILSFLSVHVFLSRLLISSSVSSLNFFSSHFSSFYLSSSPLFIWTHLYLLFSPHLFSFSSFGPISYVFISSPLLSLVLLFLARLLTFILSPLL